MLSNIREYEVPQRCPSTQWNKQVQSDHSPHLGLHIHVQMTDLQPLLFGLWQFLT